MTLFPFVSLSVTILYRAAAAASRRLGVLSAAFAGVGRFAVGQHRHFGSLRWSRSRRLRLRGDNGRLGHTGLRAVKAISLHLRRFAGSCAGARSPADG